MRTNRVALILCLMVFLAGASVALACEGTDCSCNAKAATTTAQEPSCCSGKSDAALASAAEQGCETSWNTLLAHALKSDNEEMVDLAKRAEGGCEHSKQALIAMAKHADAPAQAEKN